MSTRPIYGSQKKENKKINCEECGDHYSTGWQIRRIESNVSFSLWRNLRLEILRYPSVIFDSLNYKMQC